MIPALPGRVLETVVPCTSAGSISEQGLLQYIRHVRSASSDAVLLFGDLSRGNSLDLQEREEIYSHWRSGLTPGSQVFVALPTALTGDAASPRVERDARHGIELGADGLVVSEHVSLEVDCPIPVYRMVKTGIMTGSLLLDDAPDPVFRTAPTASSILSGFLEEYLKSHPNLEAPQSVLWMLERREVISPQFAYDPAWFPDESLKAGIKADFMRRLEPVLRGIQP